MNRSVSLLLGIVFMSVSLAQAQTKGKGDRYVFVISRINHLKAITDAVSASSDSGLDIREVRVILCGESVKVFGEENAVIESALANGKISLYACGLSLEQMKVDPALLPDEVSTVRNGILEAMVLAKKGYIGFDL